MARRKTARQRAASRRNIVKAQRISALNRKRVKRAATMVRYDPKTRRRVMIAGAVIGAAGAAGAVGYKANYDRKYVTGYHRTSHANAKQIVKTNSFASKTHTRGVEGTNSQIWFDKKRGVFAKNGNFGPATVKVRKIPKKAVMTHGESMRQHANRQANPQLASALKNPAGHIKTWMAVETSVLSGLKARPVRRPIATMLRAPGMTRASQARRQRSLARMTGPGSGQEQMNYLVSNWTPKPRRRR